MDAVSAVNSDAHTRPDTPLRSATSRPSRPRFVVPKSDAFFAPQEEAHRGEYQTYSHYNYLRPGVIPSIKRRRFEVALRLAEPYLGRGAALDFGCADGILLPSLAREFPIAVGIDRERAAVDVARAVVADLKLDNVTLVYSGDRADGIPLSVPHAPFRAIFLLETLEHVGEPGNLVPVQCAFVRRLAEWLEPDGAMVISVPRMVGFGFLAKYVGKRIARIRGDAITWPEALRAGLLNDTSALARQWSGSHEGFNDLALERALKIEFRVTRHLTLFSRFWVVKKK